MEHYTKNMALLALVPFALALGMNFGLALARQLGLLVACVIGAAVAVAAPAFLRNSRCRGGLLQDVSE